MSPRDRKLLEIRFLKSAQQVHRFNLDPAKRYLDGDFPRRYGADKHGIRFVDQLPRLDRQGLDCGPQRDLRIQQQPHLCASSESGPPPFSNSSSTSSGSGSSKFSAIQILPFSVPNLIGACFSWSNGTNMATGVPDLAMIVPSPRAAASTSSENFAFASARLNCFMPCLAMTLALDHVRHLYWQLGQGWSIFS